MTDSFRIYPEFSPEVVQPFFCCKKNLDAIKGAYEKRERRTAKGEEIKVRHSGLV